MYNEVHKNVWVHIPLLISLVVYSEYIVLLSGRSSIVIGYKNTIPAEVVLYSQRISEVVPFWSTSLFLTFEDVIGERPQVDIS